MIETKASTGYFHNGMPYNRSGHGPNPLVVFQGLTFENKPLPALMAHFFAGIYGSLDEDYTIYIVTRRPDLPVGYSMQNMSDDYATMIREEFGRAVDVIGVSTGGSIVQHFAADHAELVRKLVIHSSAYTLSDPAKKVQMRVGALARQRRWIDAYATMVGPTGGGGKTRPKAVVWIGSLLAGTFAAPQDPSDLVVTVEAEDKHNFKDRLAQIKAPTLVVAGEIDPYYTAALFRETAEGIPNARLILYEGMGHPAAGKQFGRDVLMFLKEA